MDESRPLLGARETKNPRTFYRRRVACVVILLSELLERLAFYGLSFNLVMYLYRHPLNWNAVYASSAEFTLSTFAFGFCFFAGYLADYKLGRFKTIVIFYVSLLIGYSILILTEPRTKLLCQLNRTVPWIDLKPAEHRMSNMTPYVPADNTTVFPECEPPIYLALLFIGLGTAAVRTNIAPFGADQVRAEGPESMRMFFNWLYWSINVGSLFAIIGVSYVDQEIDFLWGFTTSLAAALGALLIFLCGYSSYVRRPSPRARPLKNLFAVVYNAITTKRMSQNSMEATPGKAERSLYPALPECSTAASFNKPSFLDYAMTRHGGKFPEYVVEDAKFFFKITLIFLSIVPYWTVYFQMNTTYLLQGLHMRVRNNCSVSIEPHDDHDFSVPPAWLTAFDIACTIIFIPVVDRLIYKTLDKRGYPLSLRARIAIGMVFTILSVVSAGVLERYRLDTYWEGDVEHPCLQKFGDTVYHAADLSIFYQIPQYALIGISEIFTSIAGMEFAYAAAPKSMQGISMGLFLLFSGLGALIGVGIMSAFHGVWFFDWDNGNINCRFSCPGPGGEYKVCAECHLDYYFYFLAVFQFLGLILFLILSHCLRMGKICPCKDDTITSVNRRRKVSDQPTTGVTV